jgi:hypothetical protein
MLAVVAGDETRKGLESAMLCDVTLQHSDGVWTSTGVGSAEVASLDELRAASSGPALVRVGGSSDGLARFTWASCKPEAVTIRISSEKGTVWDRAPGRHGYVLLGVRLDEPVTYAQALDRKGRPVDGYTFPL